MQINKIVFHNVPPVIVREKSDFELNFLSTDEDMIAAQMRPQKVSSIPLDKNIMDWKKLDINKEKSRFMNEGKT